MHELTSFVLRHGYSVLFGFVLIEQSGIPLPAIPILLVMGALTAQHQFSFLASWALCILAALIGDGLWYMLGRYRGSSILNLLCRISLEPDSCVSGAKRLFRRWGSATLLFSKFVPGLGAVAPTMAGWTRLPRLRVLAADLAGGLLWSATYLGAGVVFRHQLEDVGNAVRRFGGSVALLVLFVLASWIAWKSYQRRRFIRDLRVARIRPEELMELILAGEPVSIVDLRHAIELENDPSRIPGAIWLDGENLDEQASAIPPDTEVVLYCT
jgi:membrane protein DedA with SNARE-associated domain